MFNLFLVFQLIAIGYELFHILYKKVKASKARQNLKTIKKVKTSKACKKMRASQKIKGRKKMKAFKARKKMRVRMVHKTH